MKTIKQISDEIGISKVAVYKRIDSNGFRERLVKNGNTYYIDEELEQELKNLCKDAPRFAEPKKDTSREPDKVLDVLSDNLRSKDEQIQALNEQIRTLQEQNTKLIDTIREMNIVQANTLKMLQAPEDAPEPIEMDAEVTPAEEPTEPNKGILGRLFGRR